MGRGACHPCIRLRQETAAPHWSIILSADDGSEPLTRVLIVAAVLPQSLQRQSLLRAARALRLVLAPGFGGGAWGRLMEECLFLCKSHESEKSPEPSEKENTDFLLKILIFVEKIVFL